LKETSKPRLSGSRRWSAAALGGLVVLLSAEAAMSPATAPAAQPPRRTDDGRLGAYQEPAPRAQQEKHATKFVNQILERTGARVRVSKVELRQGVALSPPRSPPRATRAEKRKQAIRAEKREHRSRLPVTRAPTIELDLGPTRRAGLSTPSNQRVPGEVLGLVLAGVLAAVGAGLEIAHRVRAGSRRVRR
jgi:hypothetical protein